MANSKEALVFIVLAIPNPKYQLLDILPYKLLRLNHFIIDDTGQKNY